MPTHPHGTSSLSFHEALHSIYPVLLPVVQWLVVLCILAAAYMLLAELVRWRLSPTAKSMVALLLVAIAAGCSCLAVCWPPLLVAKLSLIVVCLAGGFLLLIFSLQAGRFYRALSGIQQECELATNLTFLQGEMTRAQLEQLGQKIRQAAEPQEKEMTETMLKSLSPIVMLYLRKEKSIIEWSMATANMGRTLLNYFWSPKKS